MRAPLRFQELQREVEAWCREHHGECTSEFTVDDDEIPAFRIVLNNRTLHFRLVKGWPPIIEVRRDDFPDDERALRLLRVANNNAWNPPLARLIDPWVGGRPYEGF
jgi:hypothetical protein